MPLCVHHVMEPTSDNLFETYERALKNMEWRMHKLQFENCNQKLTKADASIIDSISDNMTLLPLEANYIKRRKHTINTQVEVRSHTLQYAFPCSEIPPHCLHNIVFDSIYLHTAYEHFFILATFIIPRKAGYCNHVREFVCLSVCLFVSRISHKLLVGF